jgi:undecaprenyl-diphosphatase
MITIAIRAARRWHDPIDGNLTNPVDLRASAAVRQNGEVNEPVIFVNPGSGTGTAIGELEAMFPACRVEPCPPDELAACVRRLAVAGASFVGVAGGDGTLRAAAEVLADYDVALLAVPAGTRNHFAKDFGITSLEDAAKAASGGESSRIDVGGVNDRVFLNNCCLGAYPHMVERREEQETRWPKGIANLVAAWQQLRHGRRLRVVVDGERFVAWLVFVGNGRYGESLRDVATRGTLDANVLDVRIVHADQPLARLRLFAALAFGRLALTPVVTKRECRRLTIAVPQHADVAVSLDGEVVRLATPLDYESRSGALRVLTPQLGEN